MEVKTVYDALIAGCAASGISLSPEEAEALAKYSSILLETNKHLNLTRIVEPVEVAIKHFVDSLLCTKLPVHFGGAGVDVGSGAGFPGLVLAIHLPQARVTLLDSLRKRVDFLESCITSLNLGNAEAVHGRAEDLGREEGYRESFDWAVARAVADLPVLLEYCVPFVKPGGFFVAMKAGEVSSEVERGRVAAKELGVRPAQVFQFELPLGMGERSLVLYEKERATPERFPRRAGIPTKVPLG